MLDVSYTFTEDAADVEKHIAWLNANSKYVVCDTETTGFNPRKDKLVDIQVSGTNQKHVVIFPAEHAHYLSKIEKLFVWQNMRFDLNMLYNHGVDLLHKQHWDTLLVQHLLDENMLSYSLKALIERYCGPEAGYKDDFWKTYKSYTDAPLDIRHAYGAADIYWTDYVYRAQLLELRDGALL